MRVRCAGAMERKWENKQTILMFDFLIPSLMVFILQLMSSMIDYEMRVRGSIESFNRTLKQSVWLREKALNAC